MKNSLYKKGVVFGIIILFIGMSITSSTGINLVKQSTKAILDGNILYVGGGGPGNYSNIQDAVADASEGDTIYVYSGTYNEWITLNKQLFIKGIKKPGEDYPIINGGNDHGPVVINADGCYFEDFKVRNGPGGFIQRGITLQSNNNVINNCEIYNTGRGINFVSANNNTVSNNRFHTGKRGFEFKNSHNNTCFNNHFAGLNQYGIQILDSSKNNLLYNNTIISCRLKGISVRESSHDNILTGNNISYNGQGLEVLSVSNFTAYDNIFWGNGLFISGTLEEMLTHTIENNSVNGNLYYFYAGKSGITVPTDAGQVLCFGCTDFIIKDLNITSADNGITLIYCSRMNVTNNYLKSSGPSQIFLSGSDNCTISNNNVVGWATIGLDIRGSTDCLIANNICKANKEGISLRGSSNNIITNNEIFANDMGILLQSQSNYNSISNNYIYQHSEKGIMVYTSTNNDFFKNIVTNNPKIGIYCGLSSYNTFYLNNVTNNKYGFYLFSTHKISVTRNNIINNTDNAYFVYFDIFDQLLMRTQWLNNYWDDWVGTGPYRIEGILMPSETVYNYDYSPAKAPFDITKTVNIPRSRAVNNPLILRFLEQFPLLREVLLRLIPR